MLKKFILPAEISERNELKKLINQRIGNSVEGCEERGSSDLLQYSK